MRLGIVIADHRAMQRLTVRALAKVIGIGAATLNRIEHNKPCDAATLIKIQSWLYANEKSR